MMKNARTWALGGCLAALGTLSIVGVAMGQGGFTPPNNCHCGPVAGCNGVPISHSTYCGPEYACYCRVWTDPEQGDCITMPRAQCQLAQGN